MQRFTLARNILLVLASSALFACGGSEQSAEAIDTTALELEAQEIAGQFVGTLQPTLQQAMQSGGPVEAIEVCAVEAPQIAADLSAESGWSVRRVSLRARNHEAATPDAWESDILQLFDERQAAGEAGADIREAAVVDGEYRYMQAQGTMPLCLTCHGEDLSDEVRSALADHYPDDTATGYAAGEIRGAISLRRSL